MLPVTNLSSLKRISYLPPRMLVHVVVALPTLGFFPFELLVSTFLIIVAKDRLLGADLVLEKSLIVPPDRTLNTGVY